jgi:hypothetical protein
MSMIRSDAGYRWSETYVELVDAAQWRAETTEQIHRLLAVRMSAMGQWERVSTELVHRARATRLWTAEAMRASRDQLMVDRVVDFRLVLALLVRHRADTQEILDRLAVGCIVTRAEADRLGPDRALLGWEAYVAAGIHVMDRETSAALDVVAAARRQRELVQRLEPSTFAPPGPPPGPWPPPGAWPPPSPQPWTAGARVPPPRATTVYPGIRQDRAAPVGDTPSRVEDAFADVVPRQPVVAEQPRRVPLDPPAARAPSLRTIEIYVPALQILLGPRADITHAGNWISARGEHESVELTFSTEPGPSALVVAKVHDEQGHESPAEHVVRHVSPEELHAATLEALVRALVQARLAAETRARQAEATQRSIRTADPAVQAIRDATREAVAQRQVTRDADLAATRARHAASQAEPSRVGA